MKRRTKSLPASTAPVSSAETRSAPSPLWKGAAERESTIVVVALLLGAVLAVYGRSVGFDFVRWDDDLHVFNNPYLRDGDLSLIGHFWHHAYANLYIPVSYTLFAALATAARPHGAAVIKSDTGAIFDPHVFHAANVLVHAVNVCLVFFLLRRLLRNDAAALAGSLVFAVHPIQVEAVSWISELRGLLAGFFALGSLIAFVKYADLQEAGAVGKSRAFYAISLAVGLAGMLSKPSDVVLGLWIAAIGGLLLRRAFRRSVLDALPFLTAGIAVLVYTARIQPPDRIETVAPWLRLLVAWDALSFYLWKFLIPLGFAADYARKPLTVLSHAPAWWELLLPIAVCVAAIWRRSNALRFTVAFAVSALLPVLGLVPFVYQAISTVADRYAYLALFGAAYGIAYGLARLRETNRRNAYCAAGIGIAALAALSFVQSGTWRNSERLFAHTAAITPTSYMAQTGLGSGLLDRGKPAEALVHFQIARDLEPERAITYLNLSTARRTLGDKIGAEADLRRCIALNPSAARPHAYLGTVLLETGRDDEGVRELNEAIRLGPSEYTGELDLATYFERQNDYKQAISVLAYGALYSPNRAVIWRRLGLDLIAIHQYPKALHTLGMALNADPNDAVAKAAYDSVQRRIGNPN